MTDMSCLFAQRHAGAWEQRAATCGAAVCAVLPAAAGSFLQLPARAAAAAAGGAADRQQEPRPARQPQVLLWVRPMKL